MDWIHAGGNDPFINPLSDNINCINSTWLIAYYLNQHTILNLHNFCFDLDRLWPAAILMSSICLHPIPGEQGEHQKSGCC